MDPYQLKFQKLLKGLGILEMVFGAMSLFVLITTIAKLSSGDYVLLVPTWQYILPAIVLITQQILLGIFALRFAKSEKVNYCMFAGMTLMICIALNSFILNVSEITSFTAIIAQFLFPALYTAVALNLNFYYKKANPS